MPQWYRIVGVSTTLLIIMAALGLSMTDSPLQGDRLKTATFAGGCFWCLEAVFEGLEGVTEVVSGYTGGHKDQPAYKEVSSGETGHYEAVRVTYDSSIVAYEDLLDLFWRHIDPTDPGGQFCDRGSQYRTAVFFDDETQKLLATESKEDLEKSGRFEKPIVTQILPASRFYEAEDYHQDYYKTCPVRYQSYKAASGREEYLRGVWNDDPESTDATQVEPEYRKMNPQEMAEQLTPLQYEVTQQCGTESPFENEYWDEKREGIYVDIVSGEPLFSSHDKYDSGSGWPSFTRPLGSDNVVERSDTSHGMNRTEVRSKYADSHLGHVFQDGPAPTGLRYCINSAALRFIPKEELEREGYGEYRSLFDE